MGGKTSTSTSSVAVPPEVLARYNAANDAAATAASNQYQTYSGEFVAPVNQQEQGAIQNINQAQTYAQPFIAGASNQIQQGAAAGAQGISQGLGTIDQGAALSQGLYGQSLGGLQGATSAAQNQYGTAQNNISNAQNAGNAYAGAATQGVLGATSASTPLLNAGVGLTAAGLGAGANYNNAANNYISGGTQNVNPDQFSQNAVNQYMSPYMNDVVQAQMALMNQQNAQQQSALKGNAISAGAFGGDRAGIAQANLAQQQNLSNQATLANTLQQGYGQALGAFQQQQGVGLSAQQANRAAQQFGAQQTAALGQQQYAQATGAAQNIANIGNSLYSQGLGQAQALGSLGQQQYAQGVGAAQAQAGLTGQQLAAQSGLSAAQQAAAQGLFGQAGQQAALQTQAGQNLFNMSNQAAMNQANLGMQGQQALTSGAQAQLAGGQLQQQTQQAQDQALYNQFLQQQGYPFQTAQFLANIAEGTGALSGSTTTTTQPAPFFSDRRLKEDIKRIGETDDGLPIYKYRYKGDKSEQTHIGFMADEVEDKKPNAVGEYNGYKTVDYDRATRASGGPVGDDEYSYGGQGGVAGPYANALRKGIGSSGYVPAATLAVRNLMIAKPVSGPSASGLQQVQQAINGGETLEKLYNFGKGAYNYASDKVGGGNNSSGEDNGFAGGGGVDDVEPYGDNSSAEGYMHNVMNSAKPPSALMTAQNPTGSNNSGSGLSSALGAANAAKNIYGLGSSLASGLGSLAGGAAGTAEAIGGGGEGLSSLLDLLALKRGGAVPSRHHYADGGSTEDDNSYDLSAIPDNVQALLSPEQGRKVVEEAAKKVGIDPRDPSRVFHAESRMRNVLGDEGSSGGIPQMHVGNVSKKYPNPGLGDEAINALIPDQAGKMTPQQRIAWLNADENQPAVTQYALQHIKNNGYGAWSMAKGLGLAGGAPNAGATEPKGGLSPARATLDDVANRYVSASPGAGPQQGGEGIGGLLKSEKFWIPLLKGLGTMASSNSRYLGSAVLQGLGGAADSYANLEKQQSALENQQAQTQQTYANIARDNYNPGTDMVILLERATGLRKTMRSGEFNMLPPAEKAKYTIESRTPASIPKIADSTASPSVVAPEPKPNAPLAGATTPTAPSAVPPAGTAPKPPAAANTTPANPPENGTPTPPVPAAPKPLPLSSVEPSPEAVKEGQDWAKTRYAMRDKTPEPDFYGTQAVSAQDAARQQQLLVPLAKELSSVPRKGGFAPGKLQEYLQPINAYFNNMRAVAGLPPVADASESSARQEIIDKLSSQITNGAANAAQQHAYAALGSFSKSFPGNLNQPEAMREMIAQILTNNQREIDRNNYFEKYRKSVQGDQPVLQETASASGRLANKWFDQQHGPAEYEKERQSLSQMFGDPDKREHTIDIKGPDGQKKTVPIMTYLASSPNMSPQLKEKIRAQYGQNILRYFGIQ